MMFFPRTNVNNGSPRTTSTTAAVATMIVGAWSSVAVTTFMVRQIRKRKNEWREERIAKGGGLLPTVNNIVEALQYRGGGGGGGDNSDDSSTTTATTNSTQNQLALEGANGIKYTWKDYHSQVCAFALSLQQTFGGTNDHHHHHHHRSGIAIHAFNRPEWFFSAMGAMSVGWTVSGIYLTNTYEQAKHILETSQVQVLVLEGIGLLETTYKTVLKDFPNLTVILLDGDDTDAGVNDAPLSSSSRRTLSYEAFVKANLLQEQQEKNSQQKTSCSLPLVPLDKDDVACLVYTSGTTGNPKAVELTHGNVHSVVAAMHARIPLDEKSVFVSYLPLSHIAAMGIDMFSPLYCGGAVHFADADALRGTLKDTLLRVRPTLFFGVPRVWEKMAAAFQKAAQESYQKPISGTILKSIGTVAKFVGRTWYNWSATPELVRCILLPIPFAFFRKLVFLKIRKKCGLDRAACLYTGAAPLGIETMQYLQSLDMPLLEVFGMSESCGVIAVCGPNDVIRPVGACGKVVPSMGEMAIQEQDGEIVYKGQNVMRSYKGLKEATASTINPKTMQLHTGDLGTIDKYGYLYITGRKKDLLITSGGENVSPAPIEETFKSLLNGEAGHVVLIGDGRKFLTILVAPKEEEAESTSSIAPETIKQAIATYNSSYAKSRAQRVQKAHVVDQAFTVASGELTPTMKLKRNIVVAKFAKEINAMYADGTSNLVGYSSMNLDRPE